MITLDQKSHTYTDEHGLVVPGVTSVIEYLCDYAGIPQQTLDWKSELGRKVHTACEYLDQDRLDESSVADVLQPYVDAWRQFKEDTNAEILENERIVYSARHRYAGMLDRILKLNSEICVIDIKCIAQLKPVTGVQTAAYQEAYNSSVDPEHRATKRFAVQLKPDGKYKLERYSDRADFSVFLSSLNILTWRNKHGYGSN